MNSNKNQEIKGRFIDREIIYCVSCMFSEISKIQEHLDYQDQESLWSLQTRPNHKDAVLNSEYHIIHSNYLGGFVWVDKESHSVSDNSFDTECEACEDCCDTNNIEYDYFVAYEHWIVSEYLGNKLKDKGEMVDDLMGITIWGRCTSGQAILLDNVISEICSDMEILEGQKYEWKV